MQNKIQIRLIFGIFGVKIIWKIEDLWLSLTIHFLSFHWIKIQQKELSLSSKLASDLRNTIDVGDSQQIPTSKHCHQHRRTISSVIFRATEVIWATAKVYLTMRDGHLKPEVFYATNQMKKKPNLDKIVKYLPNTRISSKKYKIDNQVQYLGLKLGSYLPWIRL